MLDPQNAAPKTGTLLCLAAPENSSYIIGQNGIVGQFILRAS
jgi:hypothetical protein